MKKFSITDVRQDMIRLLDISRRQPVIIGYQQQDAAVLMSIAEYRRLQALDELAAAADKEAKVV